MFSRLGTLALCGLTLALLLGVAPASRGAEPGYSSLWSQTQRLRRDLGRGSLLGDFHWAADAKTLKSAAIRWAAFLREHAPTEGEESDDAMQLRLTRVARIELARVYYQQQRPAEGDKLIRRLIEKP